MGILGILFLALPIRAADFNVRGFAAIDTLNIIKQTNEGQKAEMGIGTIDLKFYFSHEDFTAKVKLDLDGELSEKNNLYEEATISWQATPKSVVTAGKGKVAFHQMHYGILQSSYIDGGSILNTTHSWRDQDRKLLLSYEYGSFQDPVTHTLTFWGNSEQVIRRKNNEDYPDLTDGNNTTIPYQNLQTEGQKTFNTKRERGLAYKIDYRPNRAWSISGAGIYYDFDLNPEKNWALDMAFNYRNNGLEVWGEYVYGFWSTHPNMRFAAKKQYEQHFQLGAIQELTDLTAIGINIEAMLVNKLNHLKSDYPATGDLAYGQNYSNNGHQVNTDNIKIEIGPLFALAKRTTFKLGFMWEKKTEVDAGNKKPTLQAYQVGSGISYFF